MDSEKVIKGLYDIGEFVAERIGIERARDFIRTIDDACSMLKKQDDLLRKLQKDKDKLCLEVSEWKHKYHDRPLKEQETEDGHWIVLEYCANEGIYCSKCLNKIFERSTKPKKKLSNYCPNCGSKNTYFFNPSIMYSD